MPLEIIKSYTVSELLKEVYDFEHGGIKISFAETPIDKIMNANETYSESEIIAALFDFERGGLKVSGSFKALLRAVGNHYSTHLSADATDAVFESNDAIVPVQSMAGAVIRDNSDDLVTVSNGLYQLTPGYRYKLTSHMILINGNGGTPIKMLHDWRGPNGQIGIIGASYAVTDLTEQVTGNKAAVAFLDVEGEAPVQVGNYVLQADNNYDVIAASSSHLIEVVAVLP